MIFLLSLYVLQLVFEFYSANRNMKQTNWSLQYCFTVYFYNIIFKGIPLIFQNYIGFTAYDMTRLHVHFLMI